MFNVADFLKFLPSLSALIAIVTLAFGVWQYWKAQKWKRAEFVAAQIKEFEGNPLVRCATKMLDFPNETISVQGRNIEYDETMLAATLPHEDLIPTSTPVQADIRLAFCDFFDGLERMHHFVQTGLISAEHLTPYLLYWFRRFSTTRYASEEFLDSIWTFIDGYEYTGVRQLAEDFGFQPPKADEARERVKRRIQAGSIAESW
jgi:hypothetical protein